MASKQALLWLQDNIDFSTLIPPQENIGGDSYKQWVNRELENWIETSGVVKASGTTSEAQTKENLIKIVKKYSSAIALQGEGLQARARQRIINDPALKEWKDFVSKVGKPTRAQETRLRVLAANPKQYHKNLIKQLNRLRTQEDWEAFKKMYEELRKQRARFDEAELGIAPLSRQEKALIARGAGIRGLSDAQMSDFERRVLNTQKKFEKAPPRPTTLSRGTIIGEKEIERPTRNKVIDLFAQRGGLVDDPENRELYQRTVAETQLLPSIVQSQLAGQPLPTDDELRRLASTPEARTQASEAVLNTLVQQAMSKEPWLGRRGATKKVTDQVFREERLERLEDAYRQRQLGGIVTARDLIYRSFASRKRKPENEVTTLAEKKTLLRQLSGSKRPSLVRVNRITDNHKEGVIDVLKAEIKEEETARDKYLGGLSKNQKREFKEFERSQKVPRFV